MKAIGSLAIVVGTLLVCGIVLYQHYPTASKVEVPPVFRLVESTYPRKVVQSITVDGKKVDVEILANDTVRQPVALTAGHEIVTQPTSMDTLRYWVLVAAIVALAVYGVFVFCLWARDKLARRETKDTEDTKQRLSEIGRLCTAVALTLFGSVGLDSHPIEPPQASALPDSAVMMPPGAAGEPMPIPELPPPALAPAHTDSKGTSPNLSNIPQ